MIKEQEEAIERVNKLLELEVTPFNNSKSVLISKTDLETVLNMLKGRQIEIEIYEKQFEKINKALDIESGVAGPEASDVIKILKTVMCQQADSLKEKDKEIEKLKRDFKIVDQECSRLERKEAKQDKIIDLMAELIARKPGSRIEICQNMQCDKKVAKECKLCAKQYFKELAERKSENGN